MAGPKRSPKSRAPAVKPTRADGRIKSQLTLEGERGAIEAKRRLLLATLDERDWNLTHTAAALDMGHPSAVLRAIRELGLDTEYAAARRRREAAQARTA